MPTTKTRSKKKFSATLRFGSSEEMQEQTEFTYEFSTEKELDAFLYGVAETSGYLDYEIVRDSRAES